MIVDVLSVDDARWRTFLDRAPHDTYHLPEYARVAGHCERGEAIAFYAESGAHAVLMPLLVRPLPPELNAPSGLSDATSPYGYSGPIATKGIPPDVLRACLVAVLELARERGIVSVFLRLNPFRSMPPAVFQEFGITLNHGPVVYVDLSKSADDWWAETRGSHRDDIARLRRLGYSVEIDNWAQYPAFRRLYDTTMRRLSASDFYRFSDTYFDELRDLLGDHLHLSTVYGPERDVAASGLFLIADGLVAYHLSGTHEAHFGKAPSKLMLHVVRQWAKDVGATVLNLGGGFGGKSGSLHHFKAGFSRLEADFHTVRIVLAQDHYDSLTDATRNRRPVDTSADAFFPWYRQTDHEDESA